MKLVTCILLLYINGLWALPSEKKVGCENDPCQHICVDTVDSYYCSCYPNYVLYADNHNCISEAQTDYDAAFVGCYEQDPNYPDLNYGIWIRATDATVPACLHDCRARGFRFAGLKSGTECQCGNSYGRTGTLASTCTLPCAGAPVTTCGGTTSVAIYKVSRDSRYVGCYNEDLNNPELSALQWEATEGRSPDECGVTCASQGYNYFGLLNGGRCSCGNSYGAYGIAGEESCLVRCYGGWSAENCGGISQNAVYRTLRGQDYRAYEAQTVKDGKLRADIIASDVYDYPHNLGLYANRFVMHATDTVNNIYEDVSCLEGLCYSPCVAFDPPDYFDLYKEDVVVREYYMKLSELPNYINSPTATRVFVFVQTLYIDQSVNYAFSMYIRARQIIVNYEVNPIITFNNTSPVFGTDIINIDVALYEGAPSDLTFQKQSFMCARQLLSSEDPDPNRIAWNIIDDLVRDRNYTAEQGYFLNAIRGYRSEFTSVGRNDLHWAPYYSKQYYVDALTSYETEITLYNEEFERLMLDVENCNSLVLYGGSLITIWTETVVKQSEILKDHTEASIDITEAVYLKIYEEYKQSRTELMAAAETFKAGLEDWAAEMAKQAMRGLISSVTKLCFGIFPCGAKETAQSIADAVGGVLAGLELLEVTMENLAITMQELEAFLNVTDEMIASGDYSKYMDNIESVAGLSAILPEWQNFRVQIGIIFDDDEFYNIPGSAGFEIAVLDLCNWGEELTRTMIELASNIRLHATMEELYNNRVAMDEAYKEYFANVSSTCENEHIMAIKFAEQNYDLMLELNNQLITFCEAMYYENMASCPVTPNYMSSVQNTLVQVSAAKTAASGYFRVSCFNVSFPVVDKIADGDPCINPKDCPLRTFKEQGRFMFEVELMNGVTDGVDLLIVEEIVLEIEGVTSNSSSVYLRLLVSSSGPFFNRRGSEVDEFLSRSVSDLFFEYNINNPADIRWRAQLYTGTSGLIRHSTIFTTWLVQRDPAPIYAGFDLSATTSINIRFKGPFGQPVKKNLQRGDKTIESFTGCDETL